MSDPRLTRIERLFHAALERPPERRAAFLAEEPDAELRGRVERMLVHDAADDARLSEAVDAAVRAASATPPRSRIGSYVLLRELGAGGMGTVFLAERMFGAARQQVALKLIRGFPTREATARLARERELLAGLNHPNIARLLDGGDTGDGQPFLVMEYVEGKPLPDHCAALPIEGRLRLVVRLCRAVQHAHQRLIVHRDIKPGNVLVRADGEPVLLDFGIGKLLDAASSDTETARVFTPAYAAPEQRRGEAATTASDIYALGRLLGELLAGTTADGFRVIRDRNPDADDASRLPRGEIGQIVAKATQAEPERRYASADALAADIERCLAGQPIAALPDRFAYRARKYVSRHRYATAAIVLAAALAGVFVWRLAVERSRAIEQAQRAESARDFLLSVFEAAAPERASGKTFGVRELIDIGRQRLQADLSRQPLLQAQLLATLGQLSVSLGDPQAAVDLVEPALGLVDPHERENALIRADMHEAAGLAYRDLDRIEDSAGALMQALALRERHASGNPALLSRSLHLLGRIEHERGRLPDARPLLLRALALRERLQPPDPRAVAETRRVLALIDLDLGDAAAARREAGQVESTMRGLLPPGHPGLIEPLATHATILNRQGAFEQARSKLSEALAIARAAIGDDSIITANLENQLAESLLGLGRFRESVAHSETAYRIQQRVRSDDPFAGAIALADLGTAYSTIGDYARAEAMLVEAVAALGRTRAEDDPERLRARSNLARVQSLLGRHESALAALADIVERTAATRGERSERYAFELMRAAVAEVRAGRLDAAEARLAQAGPLFEAILPSHHPWRVELHNQRGRIALGRDDPVVAEREFSTALQLLDRQSGLAYDMRLVAGVGHIESLARLGRRAQARSELLRLKPVIESELLPTAAERVRLADIETHLAGE